jgi:hypothetical protein
VLRAATDNRFLAFLVQVGQTLGMDRAHGHAEEAGEQMHSELDAIQERLKALKRKLDARQSVYAIESEMASGDPVGMNPLTGSPPEPDAPDE